MGIFWKDLFRTIHKSIGRFLAIAGICALGVGFFGGLQMTCGSMKQELTDYFNQTNMMDIRVVCDMGISDEIVDNFKQVDDVEAVMPAYETDILVNFGSDQCSVRIHSLPESLDENNKNYINQQILSRGNWPQSSNECVLSEDAVLAYPPDIGDEIEILECSTGFNETLNVKKLKVVGFVHSSYYVQSVQMGPSVLGKGIVNDFAYVTKDFFKGSYPYSEVFITVNGSKNFVTGTDDYQNKIDKVMDDLSAIVPEQSIIRSASIRNEAQKKLDEAKDEFSKQKTKAEKELDENQKKLNDAWSKIEQAENPLMEAKKILDEQYAEFNTAKSSVLDPLNELISNSENCINISKDLQSKHNDDVANIQAFKQQVDQLSSCLDGLEGLILEMDTCINIDEELIIILQTYLPSQEIINFLEQCILDAKDIQSFSIEFYTAFKLSPSQQTYDLYISTFNIKYQTLSYDLIMRGGIFDEIINELYYLLISSLYPSRDEAVAAFDELEKPLIEAKTKLNNGFSEVDKGKAEYFAGLAAFLDAKDKAMSSLNDAQIKLDDSQKQIDQIKDANFYIMDRTKNFGAINFNNDAERIASIANVFPLMFFFVALLVVLTSMTRMIEEERISIGTYKALGFSKLRISNKFILYGIFASVIGSIIGLLVLTQFLPYVIMIAYSIIYSLPITLPMPFDFNIGIVSMLVGVGVTVVATLMAATKSLKLQPARLIIPKAPKAGKRILLEHISPIWKLLNFNWKITFRNMFLYKKRLFMTLIGIAGCTALLLTGFGLHDSISDIMNKQFDEIAHDNFKIVFTDNSNDANKDEVCNQILNYKDDSLCTVIHEENVLCMPKGHPDASTVIIAPKNNDQFQDMRVLRNRNTKESFILDDQGVYISEKLANMMQIQAGDTIKVYNQDLIGNAGSQSYEFYVAGVVENYIAHYIYMTPKMYEKYFEKECQYNSLIARCNVFGRAQQDFVEQIKNNKAVKTAFFTTNTRETYEKMLQSVDMVVIVLIVSAGLLAFVVLYNLININICERAREIATLKVLGSNKHEINMYIHRETFMLSIIGSILGLGLGFILEQFVIASAEVDYVMFGRFIYIWSYLISFGITLAFTILVSLFMRKKLFTISMVESLKSIE